MFGNPRAQGVNAYTVGATVTEDAFSGLTATLRYTRRF